MSVKLNQTLSELNDEKQLSKALQMNQVTWQNKFNMLENEFKEYKEHKELVSDTSETNDSCHALRTTYLRVFHLGTN